MLQNQAQFTAYGRAAGRAFAEADRVRAADPTCYQRQIDAAALYSRRAADLLLVQPQLQAELAAAITAAGHGDITAPTVAAAAPAFHPQAPQTYEDLVREALFALQNAAVRDELRAVLTELGANEQEQNYLLFSLYTTSPRAAARIGDGRIQAMLVDPHVVAAQQAWAAALQAGPRDATKFLYIPAVSNHADE